MATVVDIPDSQTLEALPRNEFHFYGPGRKGVLAVRELRLMSTHRIDT